MSWQYRSSFYLKDRLLQSELLHPIKRIKGDFDMEDYMDDEILLTEKEKKQGCIFAFVILILFFLFQITCYGIDSLFCISYDTSLLNFIKVISAGTINGILFIYWLKAIPKLLQFVKTRFHIE